MKVHVLMENTAVPGMAAEHGRSLFVETRRHRILFDAGQTDAFAENARRMGVDLRAADIAVLSHGHYDHGGGLTRFLELNDRAPVYARRDTFAPHYNGAGKYIGLDGALADSGRIVWTDESMQIDEELLLCACNERRKLVPAESFGLRVRTPAGALAADDFRHEQYLLVREGGRSVLFSGCSHKGIRNIAAWFAPDALVGGFHFMKLDPGAPADREALETTARELLRLPTTYYTGHCTGDEPYRFLKGIMGGRLQRLSAGLTIAL